MKDYGNEYPLRRGWFRRNLCVIIAALSGVGIIVAWAGMIILTFHLLLSAIEVELDRQLAVVEQQITEMRKP